MAEPRYDFRVDTEAWSTHADVVELVGKDRRVLELGPATGYMSKVFVERGCQVVGVELDAGMAARANEHCERVIVGDLDELDLEAELDDDRFDVIVAADVLEHLKDPLDVVRRLQRFLRPDGSFVVSLPNVAHGSVRLALLDGRFPYQDIGLLDATHLRFFTRETVERLFDDAELAIVRFNRHDLSIEASEVPFDQRRVPEDVRRLLDEDPEALTYQFVIQAVALTQPGLREIQRRLRDLAAARADAESRLRESERLLEHARATAPAQEELVAAKTRVAELDHAVAALSAREAQMRVALVAAHDRLLRQDTEILDLRGELEQAQAQTRDAEAVRQGIESEAAALREMNHRLRVRLDRILTSPPAKAYARVKGLPGVRGVVSRRAAGYEAAVRVTSRGGK